MRLNALHEDIGEIKVALGKLSDAITKLALVEERQTQAAQALERAFKAIEKIESRLTSLEHKNIFNGISNKWVDRGVTALVVAAAALIAKAAGLL
jgi:hypothetical protein